jgi:hypothetical protein
MLTYADVCLTGGEKQRVGAQVFALRAIEYSVPPCRSYISQAGGKQKKRGGKRKKGGEMTGGKKRGLSSAACPKCCVFH